MDAYKERCLHNPFSSDYDKERVGPVNRYGLLQVTPAYSIRDVTHATSSRDYEDWEIEASPDGDGNGDAGLGYEGDGIGLPINGYLNGDGEGCGQYSGYGSQKGGGRNLILARTHYYDAYSSKMPYP